MQKNLFLQKKIYLCMVNFKQKKMIAAAHKFSNVQLELLRIYSTDVSDEVLLQLRDVLSRFFADKASDEMDKLWEERDWSDDTMRDWLNTPKPKKA